MNLTREQLGQFMVSFAKRKFGHRIFGRHELIDAVVTELRQSGDWTEEDSAPVGAQNPQPRGEHLVGEVMCELRQSHALLNLSFNAWLVPAQNGASHTNGANGTDGHHQTNGHDDGMPSPEVIADRLAKLAQVSGILAAPDLPDSAFDRGSIYGDGE